jgi:hypothetical protein
MGLDIFNRGEYQDCTNVLNELATSILIEFLFLYTVYFKTRCKQNHIEAAKLFFDTYKTSIRQKTAHTMP